MIFGDPKLFAIEAMTEPHLVPPSRVWGRACVHAAGVTLGDFSEPSCGLHAIYADFAQLSHQFETLWDGDFEGLDDAAIFDRLDEAYYGVREGEDPRTRAEIGADTMRFSRFVFLTNWLESFDGWKAFLIQAAPDELRVLYKRHDNGERGALAVSTGAMRRAIEGFCRWYESEAARLEWEITREPRG